MLNISRYQAKYAFLTLADTKNGFSIPSSFGKCSLTASTSKRQSVFNFLKFGLGYKMMQNLKVSIFGLVYKMMQNLKVSLFDLVYKMMQNLKLSLFDLMCKMIQNLRVSLFDLVYKMMQNLKICATL